VLYVLLKLVVVPGLNLTKASLFDLLATTANPCLSGNPCNQALYAVLDSKTSLVVRKPEKSKWQTNYDTVKHCVGG
jgi:hypothetical protein